MRTGIRGGGLGGEDADWERVACDREKQDEARELEAYVNVCLAVMVGLIL